MNSNLSSIIRSGLSHQHNGMHETSSILFSGIHPNLLNDNYLFIICFCIHIYHVCRHVVHDHELKLAACVVK